MPRLPNTTIRGRTYFLRMRVPADIKEAMGGKAKITETLGTSDYNTAKANLRAKQLKYEKIFQEIRIKSGADKKKQAPIQKVSQEHLRSIAFNHYQKLEKQRAICTLNSDMIPYTDFSEDFEFEKYVRLHLTDDTPSGSLLGMRF